MTEPKRGDLSAAVGTHADLGAADADENSDVGSLPGVMNADDQRLDGLLPIAISPLTTRGRGRPSGAKNRRTDIVASYLVERFGDPLTASMATASMPLRDLVTELRKVASDCGLKLGASVMDIARFQRECRNDALPYIHAKRAPETFKGDPVVPIIGIGSFHQHTTVMAGAARSMEDVIDGTVNKSEPDQSVSEPAAEQSHDDMSHDKGSN